MNLKHIIAEICRTSQVQSVTPSTMRSQAEREMREICTNPVWLHKSLSVTLLRMDPEDSWRLKEMLPTARAKILAERMIRETIAADELELRLAPTIVCVTNNKNGEQ